MKRLEKISVLTAKLKKAVAEEGIGGLAGRTKGYLARAKKEKEFQREKSRVYRDILFISGCNEQLPHPTPVPRGASDGAAGGRRIYV